MKNKDFVHLHIHTEYSTLDGFGKPDDYVKRAKKMGFKYLSCTDHGSIDGLIKFQKSCSQHGIKPVMGCEAYIVPKVSKDRKNGHVLLLVKNQRGFKNLCTMLSFANTDGFYYKPRITSDMLLKHCQGLIVSTACVQSFIYNKDGIDLCRALYDTIGKDLYFEVMPHKGFRKHNKNVITLAKDSGNKVIVTNDCHYILRNQWKAQEVLLAIQRRAKWDDPDRFRFKIKDLHLRSANKMVSPHLKKLPHYSKHWLTNTLEVAEKCSDFQIKSRSINLPEFLLNETLSAYQTKEEMLFELCLMGFYDKFGYEIYKNQDYFNRFCIEFDLISSKDFILYFLIVWELVTWCKRNGILVGPGRGSVGGCLIAYLLNIHAVDPIKFGLIFDRFINEDRIDYPDIDIDFEHRKRHLVRQHLEDIWGENKIAGVSTFSRMKSKAIIRDVSRVFNINQQEVDRVAKLIDPLVEDGIEQVITEYDEGMQFKQDHPQVVKLAKQLEGQIKAKSQHAAALIISKQSLHRSGRCNLIERDGITMINWEGDDAEYVGLMKLDVLALNLLSILAETHGLVKENHNVDIDFEKIPLDDKDVLREINDGNNVGLFQLNAWATNNVIKEMGIDAFMHIPAATALARPGPSNSGMTADYIKRKHELHWDHKHEVYEDITKETFGVIVYQEQVMDVIHRIGGLPYSTADKIRKVIGKKRDAKEFAPYKKAFINGCEKQGYFSRDEAEEFWHGLQEHAKYSFNKSHATAYGMLGYWCGWLKYYYPTEFICASLTYGAKNKKNELVEEAYRLGLSLVLPRVNGNTNPNQWVAKDNKLYIPFTEVKGIGEKRALDAKKLTKQKMLPTFFTDGEKPKMSKFEEMLESIGAFRETDNMKIKPHIKDYFDFRVSVNPHDAYPNLFKLYDNSLRMNILDPALQGEYKAIKYLSKRKKILKKIKLNGWQTFTGSLSECHECKLRDECTEPVLPSVGKYNIMFNGEAPGFEEDREGIPFFDSARAGSKLWSAVKKAGYDRSQFYVTNMNKCYPSISRTPQVNEIKECSYWLKKEIKKVKPIAIVAFGNANMQFFHGKKSGIISMSGKIEWFDKYNCWVIWCLHPAAVLHNPENAAYFNAGTKSMFRFFRAIGIKRMV